jgi:hypothetical protein
MAATSCVLALSLVRYPDAPALSARAAYCSSACMLSTSMRNLGFSERICLISSMPLLPGMDMSSNNTSKSHSRTHFITSAPFCVSAIAVRSFVSVSNYFRPSRTMV